MAQLRFEEKIVPPVLYSGTTERYIEWYTGADGLYRVPFGQVIDAILGDTRCWPRDWDEARMGPRATLIIDSERAYSGLMTAFSSHFRFAQLPAGSFLVLRESQGSFNHSDYTQRLRELEQELLQHI